MEQRRHAQDDGAALALDEGQRPLAVEAAGQHDLCLLYTSDAADERSSVDLGGRRIIKKKKRLIL